MKRPQQLHDHNVIVGLIDQAVSSASNFVLVIFVARESSAAEFGSFAVAQAIFLFTLGLSQTVVGEAYMIRRARAVDDGRALRGSALGCAALIGILQLFVIMPAALALISPATYALIVFSIITPFLLIQDAMRYVTVSEGRAGAALANDAVWLVTSAPAMAFASTTHSGPLVAIIIWGCCGAVCGLVFCARERLWPRPTEGFGWIAGHRDLTLRFALEFSVTTGASQFAVVILTSIVKLVGVGALRANQLLFGPLNVSVNGARLAFIPQLLSTPRAARLRSWAFYSGAILTFTVMYGIAVCAIPSDLGEKILGQTWELAQSLRGIFAIQYVLLALNTMLIIWLRAIPNPKASLRVRLWFGLSTITLPGLMAIRFGVSGAAWGLTAALAISVVAGATYVSRDVLMNRSQA